MTIKSTIPALVACLALGGAGAALAQTSAQENTAATVGAGAAEASPAGASAGGLTAGTAASRGYERRSDKANKHDRRRARTTSPAEAVNSASTYGAGALSTTRDSANVGVTTGGSASGTGSQSAGSTVDAYGETTRDGSSADLYGDSTAQSGGR